MSDGEQILRQKRAIANKVLAWGVGNIVVYHSVDGTITYTKSGVDLVMPGSGPLKIKNYHSCQFGIWRMDEGSYGIATDTYVAEGLLRQSRLLHGASFLP